MGLNKIVLKQLDMAKEARMARAKEQGFSSKKWFHGTAAGDIEAFDISKAGDGLHGRGVYMTDNPVIAGGPNPIAPQGYATSESLNKSILVEQELAAETAKLRETLSNPDLPDAHRKILNEWLVNNEADTKAQGSRQTGAPTVYPVLNKVQNPFNPYSGKIKRSDIPKEVMSALDNAAYEKGETLAGKWPMTWDRMSYYLGNDGANNVLKQMGYDGLRYPGGAMTGVGTKHEVTVAFDPANIRSTNAAFDPANIGKNDLLGYVNPRLLAPIAAGSAAALAADDSEAGMKVWHGSPHKFDKFDSSKMGTGEGAQAYGAGHYLAGRKEVGEYYRNALGGWDVEYGSPEVQQEIASATNYADQAWIGFREALTEADGDANKAAGMLEEFYSNGANPDMKVAYQTMAARLRDGSLSPKRTGHLYEAEIPDDGAYLLWDKPLSEQPESVQVAVKKVIAQAQEDAANGPGSINGSVVASSRSTKYASVDDLDSLDGASIQQMLAKVYGDQGTSAELKKAGIPGIKYLDGSSRGAGEGEHNYVIFDDNDVQIKSRGKATPAMLATTAAVGGAAVAAQNEANFNFGDSDPAPDPETAIPDRGYGYRYGTEQNPDVDGWGSNPPFDSPVKGEGYYGGMVRTDDPNSRSSEVSIGLTINGKNYHVPALVPGLTKPEIDTILAGKKLPDSVYRKAGNWAKQRINAGLPVYATASEEGRFKPVEEPVDDPKVAAAYEKYRSNRASKKPAWEYARQGGEALRTIVQSVAAGVMGSAYRLGGYLTPEPLQNTQAQAATLESKIGYAPEGENIFLDRLTQEMEQFDKDLQPLVRGFKQTPIYKGYEALPERAQGIVDEGLNLIGP